jgi:Lysylphosphatidylglycerol synthase TM region
MTETESISKKKPDFRSLLKKWGPWLVAVAALYFVFRQVPLTKVADSVLHVNLAIFLPLLLINLAFHFLWDSLIYTMLFRWFGADVKYRGMVPVRGASYVLMILNFFAGQGGMALLMNRWKGIPIKRVGSIMLFTIFNDYYLLMVFCLAGAFRLDGIDLTEFFAKSEEADLVRFIILSWVYFVFHVSFYRLYLPRTQRFKFFKEHEVFSSFRESSVWMYLKLGVIKCPLFLASLFTCYYILSAFGLHVPLNYLIVFLPIVWLISSMPITVMGLGTTQAAMIWLVARFAEGSGGPEDIQAAVVAYSILWWFSYNLGRFIIGGVCVTRLPKHIWENKK